jgi:hypothetical protein
VGFTLTLSPKWGCDIHGHCKVYHAHSRNFLINVIISYGPFMVSKMRVLHFRGGHLHYITNSVQKKEGATYIYIIYLNVNRVPIIHFENILKIYLKYVKNMPLFHNILQIILLLQVLPKIYKE